MLHAMKRNMKSSTANPRRGNALSMTLVQYRRTVGRTCTISYTKPLGGEVPTPRGVGRAPRPTWRRRGTCCRVSVLLAGMTTQPRGRRVDAGDVRPRGFARRAPGHHEVAGGRGGGPLRAAPPAPPPPPHPPPPAPPPPPPGPPAL